MPGVTISTAVRTGAVNTGVAPAATFFVVGETTRGIDTEAVLVTSLEDYETKFGAHTTGQYTWYSLRTFFEEGGVNAYVGRATASDAVAASAALLDSTSGAGLTLTAVGDGSWGNDLEAVVTVDGSEFTLTVSYEGSEIFSGTYTSLSGALTGINFSSGAANYFTAAYTVGADPTETLEANAGEAFTSGDNGTIAKSDFVSALDLFSAELGSGCVAAPGVVTGSSDDSVYTGLREHAVAMNRIALCSFSTGTSLSGARSASEAYTGTEGHEHMAFYHPWVVIPSGTVTVSIPPEGYVAGARSRSHNQVGPWRAFAGVNSEAQFVSGLDMSVSRSEGDLMEAARVNPLRVINGRVRIYGARSHSTVTEQWRFITARDTINYIVVEAEKRLEDLVFSTIDGRQTLFANIINACQAVLEPVRINGGLYEGFTADGRRIDYGYTVKCDSSINPLSQLEAGTVRCRVGVRVSSVGDKIEVELIKSNLTTALA
jgi:phage tail sheath protein FI